MIEAPYYYIRMRHRGKKLGYSPWSPPVAIKAPDPQVALTTERQKIIPNDAAMNTCFGWSNSMNADGSVLVVGAYMDDSPKVDAGSAYVFEKQADGLYIQTAKLVTADAAAGDAIGRSVDISRDGTLVALGVYQDDDRGFNSGSAYLFAKVSAKQWVQLTKLTSSDGVKEDFFGYTVALSGDGSTLCVGATYDDDNGSACGSVYVYHKGSSNWTLAAKFVPSELKASDMFGIAIDLSLDGNTAVVGSHRCSKTVLNEGAVYLFTRTNGTWAKTVVLRPPDPNYNANFGISVKLTNDGTKLFVGACRDSNGKGAVYIYAREGTTWIIQQKLQPPEPGLTDNFGISVAASADGGVLIVGAYFRKVGDLTNVGSAYVFKKSGVLWAYEREVTSSDGTKNDNFGRAVALNEKGTIAAINAVSLLSLQAASYVFT